MKFEQVIGLEVHCELKTESKMFSSSPVTFGKEPNTMVNEVDMSMPGVLPVLNKRVVEYAIRVCHALHMEIDDVLCFDRKNYYYADLPKGFQITQNKRPIGRNGYLDIVIDNQMKRIRIERLHMEEDTAKQSHYDSYSLIDYNRSGIPLIEIVTKPDIRNGKEAAIYLEKLRQVFIYTDVSDAKMEEGSMRCDINVSIRPYGSQELGIRTEIKNLNSISHVQKAIEFETLRQENIILHGGTITQETRRFDENTQQTIMMRSKEDTIDYKYYTEPNILPICLDYQWIMDIKKHLPMLADEREQQYIQKHGLSQMDAHILAYHKDMSDFYDDVVQQCTEYKTVCHWLLGEGQAYLNKYNLSLRQTKLVASYLAEMISFIQEGIISSKQAKIIFECMMSEGKDPQTIIEEKGIKQISDIETLTCLINEILDDNQTFIDNYEHRKDKVLSFLMGQMMKKTKGQANPKIAHQILLKLLEDRVH
ncbi:MAG: Asp-tRNA(Asn)/Glu-tRNA(Gln) amidotransferase subunit GatB [Coprobacillus sp.]|nr:Asp-tRNA(Asn)/Glu-tRNA(Gln) amidotransferase subunit GatB [Coprobacillus sp.]